MILQELSTDFQTVCHNGHSQDEVFFNINGKYISIKDINFSIVHDGLIVTVITDEEKNTNEN